MLEGQVLPVSVCLGTRDCDHIEATVSLRTSPDYRGPLTGKLLNCKGNPGMELVPNCSDPTRNDVNHLGMIGFRFGLPNGNVGPNTTVTYQVLTSTDAIALGRCTRLGDPPVDSDATHLRIDDESGNTLYVTIRVTGTSCGFA